MIQGALHTGVEHQCKHMAWICRLKERTHSTKWKEHTGYTSMNHNVTIHSAKEETISIKRLQGRTTSKKKYLSVWSSCFCFFPSTPPSSHCQRLLFTCRLSTKVYLLLESRTAFLIETWTVSTNERKRRRKYGTVDVHNVIFLVIFFNSILTFYSIFI